MKIWDYIKEKLFNKKQALPEPKENMINKAASNSRKQAFDEVLKVDVDIKPNTLEFAIDQYMAALIVQDNFEQRFSPYDALIKLGALKTLTSGNNRNNQNEFLERLDEGMYGKNAKAFHIQKNEDTDEPEFYHISNCGGFDLKSIYYRVYLNCKKENVALLASEFAKELEENEYYFKFNADQVKNERAEQFVFYIRNEKELNINMSAIDNVRQRNPKLFEHSNCLNPFMKTVDGFMGYAQEPRSGKYVDLNGIVHDKCVVSYNDLLSKVLTDSFVNSAHKVATNELNIDLSQYSNIEQIVSSKFLETIYQDDNLKMKFIESVKQNLKLASERNPELDIKGIDTKTKNQEKNITDYTPKNY